MHAIEQMVLLRDFIGEATAAHWSDVNLLRRLNGAQNLIAIQVAMTPGQWLIKSGSVTPSGSVITLPSDCSKPIYLEETSSGRPISWINSVAQRRVSRGYGANISDNTPGMREAYPLRKTIEVNQASYTTACTLWYQIRVPDLAYGTGSASCGANALGMEGAMFPHFVDDYYNNVTVVVQDDGTGFIDIVSEISNYAATNFVATITGTPAASDLYGTVSMLPEETHYLMVLEAAVNALSKPSSNLDKGVLSQYRNDRNTERNRVYSWLASRVPEAAHMTATEIY